MKTAVVSRAHSRVRLSLVAAVLAATVASAIAIELPIEVHSWDASPAQKAVSVTIPGSPTATTLYLEIHNLRYGGIASVQVDSQPWVDLYNHTVRVWEADRKFGGIGGIHGTVRMEVPLQTPVGGGAHTVRFRFNGTNGFVSGFRVLDFDFRTSGGAALLDPATFTQANPNTWTKIYSDQTSLNRGRDVFTGATAVTLVDSVVSNRVMKASCADCHFKDGSDLHYFNYSNDSIVTRARFHGVSLADAEKIASYIRSMSDAPARPNPGRPWNPPFQPGPGTDANLAVKWAGGAGLANVLDDEKDAINHIFRPANLADTSQITFTEVAKVIDHKGNFSVRNIPIGIQFPDWNSWLPQHSPRDIWPGGTFNFEGSAAENSYLDLISQVNTPTKVTNLKNAGRLRDEVGEFEYEVEQWIRSGCTDCESSFRVYSGTALNARAGRFTGEEAKLNLTKWLATKTFEVIQLYDLMDETQDDAPGDDPKYRGEVLAFPSNQQSVFFVAPHLTADNIFHYEWQEKSLGKPLSHQWYQLQLTVNAGMRQIAAMNTTLDWDYQINHTTDAGQYAGLWSGIRQLLTRIKLYESRDNGFNGPNPNLALIDQLGFSPRSTHPWTFFSDNFGDESSFRGSLSQLQPGLWRKVFEEFVYEYLDVLESLDLTDTTHVPRGNDKFKLPPRTAKATPFTGAFGDEIFPKPDQDHCINSYRLLPLADQAGIDKLTLLDFAAWAQKAWDQASPANNFSSQVSLAKLIYHDTFEATSTLFAQYSRIAIKTAGWVNNNTIAPRNGGGRYVITRSVAANSSRTNGLAMAKNLNGATKLRVRARVAFDTTNTAGPDFRIQCTFNTSPSPTTVNAPILVLNGALMKKKFVTYEETINVPAGATQLTNVDLHWFNHGAAQGTAYVDNVEVLNVSPVADTPSGAPAVPGAATVTQNRTDRVDVSWAAGSETDLAGYHLYRWRNDQTEADKVRITNLPFKGTLYKDFAVQSGTAYRYKLASIDNAGNESAPSAVSTLATFNGVPTGVWAPSFAKADVRTSPLRVEVTWFAAWKSWDIQGYEVHRRPAGGGTFTKISGAGMLTAFTFTDANVTSGQAYDYKVLAIDLDGHDSDTGPVTAMVLNVQP